MTALVSGTYLVVNLSTILVRNLIDGKQQWSTQAKKSVNTNQTNPLNTHERIFHVTVYLASTSGYSMSSYGKDLTSYQLSKFTHPILAVILVWKKHARSITVFSWNLSYFCYKNCFSIFSFKALDVSECSIARNLANISYYVYYVVFLSICMS